jgi:hypothetical protein
MSSRSQVPARTARAASGRNSPTAVDVGALRTRLRAGVALARATLSGRRLSAGRALRPTRRTVDESRLPLRPFACVSERPARRRSWLRSLSSGCLNCDARARQRVSAQLVSDRPSPVNSHAAHDAYCLSARPTAIEPSAGRGRPGANGGGAAPTIVRTAVRAQVRLARMRLRLRLT